MVIRKWLDRRRARRVMAILNHPDAIRTTRPGWGPRRYEMDVDYPGVAVAYPVNG